MEYRVLYSAEARKALKQIDKYQAQIILGWIEKNLIGCNNPRLHGKPLMYDRKGEWRYRVGAYRLLANIQDSTVTIEIINVGHRKNIYKR